LEYIRHALSPQGAGLLLAMISNSGKSLNQLGEQNACQNIQDTEYAVMSVQGAPIRAEIGLCIPRT